MHWLKQLDLNINNIVGQCYDGASAMRGTFKGVAARLVRTVPTRGGQVRTFSSTSTDISRLRYKFLK